MQRLRDVDQMEGYFQNGWVMQFAVNDLDESVDYQRLIQRLNETGQAYGTRHVDEQVKVWVIDDPTLEDEDEGDS